jgi:hypothetical protein
LLTIVAEVFVTVVVEVVMIDEVKLSVNDERPTPVDVRRFVTVVVGEGTSFFMTVVVPLVFGVTDSAAVVVVVVDDTIVVVVVVTVTTIPAVPITIVVCAFPALSVTEKLEDAVSVVVPDEPGATDDVTVMAHEVAVA